MSPVQMGGDGGGDRDAGPGVSIARLCAVAAEYLFTIYLRTLLLLLLLRCCSVAGRCTPSASSQQPVQCAARHYSEARCTAPSYRPYQRHPEPAKLEPPPPANLTPAASRPSTSGQGVS